MTPARARILADLTRAADALDALADALATDGSDEAAGEAHDAYLDVTAARAGLVAEWADDEHAARIAAAHAEADAREAARGF